MTAWMMLAACLGMVEAAQGLEAVPVEADVEREVGAEWEREGRAAPRPVNPSGEVAGAATWEDAAGAVDGQKTGSFGFHTTRSDNPWWQVDLGASTELAQIVVYNRNENGLESRANGMKVLLSEDGVTWQEVFQHSGPPFGGARDGKPLVVDLTGRGLRARWVRCQVPGNVSFHLDEVEVYGATEPTVNLALNKPADQSSAGRWSVPKPGAVGPPDGSYAVRRTLEVLAGARRALEHLARADGNARSAQEAELDRLQERAEALERADATEEAARKEVYLAARATLREVLLSHPALRFGALLFVKRHPGVLAHMCDQYFGSFARGGGGLYVLAGLGGRLTLTDLIAGRLPDGSYLGPDLSWDGERVVFAYAKVDPTRQAVRWDGSAELAYHLYTVKVDGTELRQLTDGPFDDIHPCWLPDGDIAFMSTRRGGQTRCSGRPVPTYVLYRMRPDGPGITQLSAHETHEWTPAVGHDGSILYTRWDYVDRHTNIAHSLWSCRADGSGAMAVYGNYNHDRKPWGLWQARPVPGSHKLIATAGAHHGYACGSLVMIDPLRGADGQGPLERLTPEVAFPEAEGYPSSAYTTPWPLDEDTWLVSYSPSWSTRDAQHTVTMGIYVQDRHGNRELLYRDPRISSESAIPLTPRLRPPAYPFKPAETADRGRLLVLDVTRSLAAFPPVRITGLRIVQVLPKTTYAADDPKMSVARQISARQVLGTVPVEADGSAYFWAPARVPLYFQAIGEDGMAVQTMRSVAYLEPGETRSCVGCHEARHSTPSLRRPLAARRGASEPVPGPEGSRPFSFLRLVQPVLDHHCIRCHSAGGQAEQMLLTGTFPSDQDPFTHSYCSLARRELVPWFDSINGGQWIPQTPPGQWGARVSKLVQMLREGHRGVNLPAEDLARICLWVDLNVPFYGCYEPAHVAMQRRGEVVPEGEMLR